MKTLLPCVSPGLRLFTLAALAGMLPLLSCSVAKAQATKIFVGSFGNDANDGSRGSPKRNFQAAHDAVAAGGQIVVLDTSGYGALNITKSIAVTVPPGVNGFITVPLGTTTAININASATDIVALRGLIIEGGANRASETPGTNYGIFATSVGVLTVEDCTIRNFYDGLFFFPSGNGASVNVFNTEVTNCRYGIDIEAPGAALIAGIVTGCRIANNGAGLYTGGGPGGTGVTLQDTSLVSNQPGIYCANGGNVVVSNCSVFNNGPFITRPAGTSSVNTVGNNTIYLNFPPSSFTGGFTTQ
jgi:hypothetical protein